MAERIFFTSPEHAQRFLDVMRRIGKIYDGRLDQEYGAAVYVLTSSTGLWQKAQDYVDRSGIDIPAMLKEVDLSSGYRVLVMLAGNLFNDMTHCDAIELMRLDASNFTLALTALQVRRVSLHEQDVDS